jgi:opacity protein-like surface antigen
MRTKLTLALLLVGALALLAPSPARADAFVTPFIGATFGGDAPASEPTYGVALGGMAGGIFGIEGEFSYTPNFFASSGDHSDSHVLTLMANLLVGAPLGAFRPYVTAGAGLIRQHNEFTVSDILTDISSNDFGINAGGGARFMFGEHVGIRADLRYFKVRKSGGLGFWRGYGGLNLAW